MNEKNHSAYERLKIQLLLLLLVLAGAIILDLVISPLLKERPQGLELAGHLSIAMYVSFILGLLYELSKDRLLEKRMDEIVEIIKREAKLLFETVGTLSPTEIFDLIKDIASTPNQIPTLYKPARSTAEYNFIEDNRYFDRLIPAGRPSLVQALKSWLQPVSHHNIKFLASDFVGKYRIDELKEYLLEQETPKLEKWLELEKKDKDWIMNYYWAASRCDSPSYKTLGELLQTTPHKDIQEWILFVPLQMPDEEFVSIIDGYLQNQSNSISQGCMSLVIRSLAALEQNQFSATKVFSKHIALFDTEQAQKEIKEAYQLLMLPPPSILNKRQANNSAKSTKPY